MIDWVAIKSAADNRWITGLLRPGFLHSGRWFSKKRETPSVTPRQSTRPLTPSDIAAVNGVSFGQNKDTKATPTWTPPTEQNLQGTAYEMRRAMQNDTMAGLNSALASNISPKVKDAYGLPSTFNMSREAMLRRINMLKRQQELDGQLLQASK